MRDVDDGVGVHWLPGVTSWEHLAFGPGDASLVAASGGAVQLWDMTGEGKHQELLPPAPAGSNIVHRGCTERGRLLRGCDRCRWSRSRVATAGEACRDSRHVARFGKPGTFAAA